MERISWTLFFALLAVLILPLSAQADCSNPAGEEGVQMYNSTYKVMQFCDGTTWWSMRRGDGGSGGSINCTALGDICSDGTIYAGLSSGDILYTTRADSGDAYWGTKGFETGANSIGDGATNTATIYAHVIAGDGDYNPDDGKTPNAVQICTELTTGGHSDWYLPSQNELDTLYHNRVQIGNFEAMESYWSSTEWGTANAKAKYYETGDAVTPLKRGKNMVRCIRKN